MIVDIVAACLTIGVLAYFSIFLSALEQRNRIDTDDPLPYGRYKIVESEKKLYVKVIYHKFLGIIPLWTYLRRYDCGTRLVVSFDSEEEVLQVIKKMMDRYERKRKIGWTPRNVKEIYHN